MSHIKTPKGRFYYNKKTLYLGIKQIDKVQSLENLKLVAEIMYKNNLSWGPAFGSLLGMVREHDFIEWDEDIDIYILEEQEDTFRNVLWEFKDVGFELVRYYRRGLYSIMRKGEYMDFYVLRKMSDNLRETRGGGYVFEKYIQDTIEIDFQGIKLSVPREYDEYLTFQYGDWRTPIQYANFEMNKVQRYLFMLKLQLMNCLPDCVYFYLLNRYHQKDFQKFKEKCRKKGILLNENVNL